jgi:hypothetical protein
LGVYGTLLFSKELFIYKMELEQKNHKTLPYEEEIFKKEGNSQAS